MAATTTSTLDPKTTDAVRAFARRLSGGHEPPRMIVFGSRARGDHRADSDVDLAVLLPGPRGDRTAPLIEMAGVAFEAMLETGVLVEALPLWTEELEHPETFGNPALIRAIRREGVAVRPAR